MIDPMRFRSFTSSGDADAEAAWVSLLFDNSPWWMTGSLPFFVRVQRVEPIGRDKDENIYWLFDGSSILSSSSLVSFHPLSLVFCN